MITRDSIETAYSFLHQKRQVYIHSSLDWQKDDIEYAIASYADDMSQELYDLIADGRYQKFRYGVPAIIIAQLLITGYILYQ